MTGQMNAYLLLAAPLAPLAGAMLAGLFGTGFIALPFHPRLSRLFTISGIGISFLVSLYALYHTAQGSVLSHTLYSWVSSGAFDARIGFLVDRLTALMMCAVTSVSLLVHIYSVGYMKDDPGNSRFFACTAFFTFAMLMLVMANNFLQLFFGWEAVGLASYLLIGFWYERSSAATAGTRAFLINRISDAVFIVGIGLLFSAAGSFQFHDIFALRHEIAATTLPGTDWNLMTVSCLCLFVGAMGKSAQFPFHVWLPDSMEGPTPVSALIHAATMVTAGIFMVARLSPLFELSDTALSCMLITGGVTALFMGLVAMVQNDIKQVIAYSTISQLGYMTLALGASAYSVAIFHLVTHAFFKALLFLVAGAVIVGMNHDQDIRNMGGLRKYMPMAWTTGLVASLSLAGAPFFSGFYSKESIILALRRMQDMPGSHFALIAASAGIFITAFYTFRLFFLVFHGKPRFGKIPPDPKAEHEKTAPHEHLGIFPGETPHGVPRIMTIPLAVLAIPSFLIGAVMVAPIVSGDLLGPATFTDVAKHPAILQLAADFPGTIFMALYELVSPTFLLLIAGAGTAVWFYLVNPQLPERLANAVPVLYRLLLNQYYLIFVSGKLLALGARLSEKLRSLGERTNFSERVVTRFVLFLGNGLWKIGEIRFLDGLITNGSARLVSCFSGIIRHMQSGYLYHYAFVMILSLLCFLLYFCR
ncbi:NADH-quinone oxidoreductase subunit L [Oxalobacter sp. OttesenSCG-928-P03]|nr:NADH-quinone oxidoreductase subunit L [Oxalobacter sp. OttesenSCG-928-P03]